MWNPGSRTCDLCGNPIVDDVFPMFLLPLTAEQLERIAQAQTELMPAAVGKMFGNMMPIMLPSHYRLEFCQGCTDGFMPMMEDLREKAVQIIIRRLQRRAAKAASGDEKRGINIAEDGDN